MWVRGLKPLLAYQKICQDYVAPYVGAWIETPLMSLIDKMKLVAPYVGAWIETISNCEGSAWSRVAPYVGAWIETSNRLPYVISSESHPMWVRGLKQ